MCKIVVSSCGTQIETPREFRDYFGYLPNKNRHYDTIEEDCCLCQCDIEGTFNEIKIPFEIKAGDLYVS